MHDTKTNYLKFGIFLFFLLSAFAVQPVFAADIYVDANNTSGIEDGSAENPYNTIGAALVKAGANPETSRQIAVKPGTYAEKIEFPDGTTLSGDNRDTVIINREDLEGTTVTMGNNCTIENLTVKGGNYGLIVPALKKSVIRNCTVEKAKRIGIWIKQSNILPTNAVEIWDSIISNNYKKGVFAETRFIYILNNHFDNNGEEGIDLRSKMRGIISGNAIESNGEGGIELEIRNTAIEISSNSLNNNRSNGITLNNRTHVGGKIIIKGNTIENNYKYGIRCSGSKSWSKKLWKKSIKNSKNSIARNVRKNISKSCNRK
jgi:parallel beta-helix repeat protein